MKIKTKLIISLGFLFVMILVLSALAIRQVRVLGSDTKNILVANYQSMEYARTMYKILDDDKLQTDSLKFLDNLNKQIANVTEPGEQELTYNLNTVVKQLLKDPDNIALKKNVRQDLNSIMKLNMDAIKHKDTIAENTAKQSVLWISITSSLCLIIGFTLIVNLPGYIANPVKDLTESIRQIAEKNYSRRIKISGRDEFANLARSFNTMAQKLQEYSNSNLAKLMMEKKRIETLINNLHDPVIGLDEKNRILFINEAALKISGIINQNIVGKQAEEIAVQNDLMRSLLKSLGEDKKQQQETLKIYYDNRESYFEKQEIPIRIIPTGETDKKQIGLFLILRNVTPYKLLDEAKTNFIATVSHEFKTPIASMKLSLQLLENNKTGTLNNEQKELLAGLKDDTERLLRTTGELLNITHLETGNYKLKTESCNVGEIINQVLLSVQKIADQKNIYLENNVAALFNIVADKEKAVWIISNLLSNAIRYSYDNSSIKINSFTTATHIEIAIVDNGVGIESQYHAKVFDKYFRVPGNEKEGTGLGLAISNEFLYAMGGYIKLKSELGSGSTFTAGFKKV